MTRAPHSTLGLSFPVRTACPASGEAVILIGR